MNLSRNESIAQSDGLLIRVGSFCFTSDEPKDLEDILNDCGDVDLYDFGDAGSVATFDAPSLAPDDLDFLETADFELFADDEDLELSSSASLKDDDDYYHPPQEHQWTDILNWIDELVRDSDDDDDERSCGLLADVFDHFDQESPKVGHDGFSVDPWNVDSWIMDVDPFICEHHIESIMNWSSRIEDVLVESGETKIRVAEYDDIKQRLYTGMRMILKRYPYNEGDDRIYAKPRMFLNTLYEEIICDMQNILERVGEIALPVDKEGSAPLKDFVTYMQIWLCENWINPYPDDQHVTQIAYDCNTTTDVVWNWIFNARSRKWRPYNIEAMKLGRPKQYLLEDAINLFTGAPLRELDDCEKQSAEDYPAVCNKRLKTN